MAWYIFERILAGNRLSVIPHLPAPASRRQGLRNPKELITMNNELRTMNFINELRTMNHELKIRFTDFTINIRRLSDGYKV